MQYDTPLGYPQTSRPMSRILKYPTLHINAKRFFFNYGKIFSHENAHLLVLTLNIAGTIIPTLKPDKEGNITCENFKLIKTPGIGGQKPDSLTISVKPLMLKEGQPVNEDLTKSIEASIERHWGKFQDDKLKKYQQQATTLNASLPYTSHYRAQNLYDVMKVQLPKLVLNYSNSLGQLVPRFMHMWGGDMDANFERLTPKQYIRIPYLDANQLPDQSFSIGVTNVDQFSPELQDGLNAAVVSLSQLFGQYNYSNPSANDDLYRLIKEFMWFTLVKATQHIPVLYGLAEEFAMLCAYEPDKALSYGIRIGANGHDDLHQGRKDIRLERNLGDGRFSEYTVSNGINYYCYQQITKSPAPTVLTFALDFEDNNHVSGEAVYI